MGARLEGKVAIVTGAGGGIGKQHALLLAAEGAKVVVNDTGLRSGADAASVVAEIEAAGGTAIADTHSATWSGAADIAATATDTYGPVDILINNATAGGRTGDLWKYTEEDWDRSLDVNLKGYFAMIRAVAEGMSRQSSGAIVNTSSGSGFGHPSMVAYSAAKEGVVGLTRTVARELGRFGVRCNAIRPLATGESTKEYATRTSKFTELMALTMGPRATTMSPTIADPEALAPRKISAIVVWLCTDAARNVNGRTFHIGGDRLSRLSEPDRERIMYMAGGWTLDGLDASAPSHLVEDLTNDYTLDGHPELKDFDAWNGRT